MKRDSSIRRAAYTAALLVGWTAAPAAEALTIRLSGHVPTRCTGSLYITEHSGPVREGLISTNCNARYALSVIYPAELGRIDVEYAGRIVHGDDGAADLEAFAPPAVKTSAVRVHFLDEDAPQQTNVLALTISPQGL